MSVESGKVASHVADVRERIAAACSRCGRNPDDVVLVAVTKYASMDQTQAAVNAGCAVLGEARWPDYAEKIERFGKQVTWHFIGHLQTNKVKYAIGDFAVVHSLDRMSLAKELSRQAVSKRVSVDVFIQVNVSGEESKFGLEPADAEGFIHEVMNLPGLKPIGLMTMAPYSDDPETARVHFRALRELRDQLNRVLPQEHFLPGLSMGMSNDFEVAIEEGATHVRIGSGLFEE